MILGFLLSCTEELPVGFGGTTGTAETAGGILLMGFAPGTFTMGCTPGQRCDEHTQEYTPEPEPPTPVRLTNAFLFSRFEVTDQEWFDIMGAPPKEEACTNCGFPVESLSWYQAAAFTNALSRAEGLEECYGCSGDGATTSCTVYRNAYDCRGYRLPTDAEWEYVARCGQDFRFAGSDNPEDVGWVFDYCGSDRLCEYTLHKGGLKLHNGCDIYDMTGNVAELLHDCDSPYPPGTEEDPAVNPLGREGCPDRAERGSPFYGAVSDRDSVSPDGGRGVGMRIARTVDGEN